MSSLYSSLSTIIQEGISKFRATGNIDRIVVITGRRPRSPWREKMLVMSVVYPHAQNSAGHLISTQEIFMEEVNGGKFDSG